MRHFIGCVPGHTGRMASRRARGLVGGRGRIGATGVCVGGWGATTPSRPNSFGEDPCRRNGFVNLAMALERLLSYHHFHCSRSLAPDLCPSLQAGCSDTLPARSCRAAPRYVLLTWQPRTFSLRSPPCHIRPGLCEGTTIVPQPWRESAPPSDRSCHIYIPPIRYHPAPTRPARLARRPGPAPAPCPRR